MSSPYPESSLWPDTWAAATFTGAVSDWGGDPATVRIEIRPDLDQSITADGVIVIPQWRVIPTDAEGRFSVQIPATNDPDTDPTGWRYLVRFNALSASWTVHMDAPAGDTVDLATIMANHFGGA